MIFVSRAIPINEPGAARLDRAAVWEGLVRKANNALPFVPVMSECTVVARYGETCFACSPQQKPMPKRTDQVRVLGRFVSEGPRSEPLP